MQIYHFLVIFILGLASIIGQVIILRELSQVFYGNELSLAMILTAWLFWGAVGAGILGKIGPRFKDKSKIYFQLLLIGTFILLSILVLIKFARTILHILPGEIISFPTMFLISFIVVAPFSILQGLLFTLAPYLLPEKELPARINLVYLIEALGAFSGGVFFYFLTVHRLDSFQNIFLLNAVVLFSCFLFLLRIKKNKTLAFLFILFSLLNFSLTFTHKIHQKITFLSYHPFHLLHTADSTYGNITLIKHEEDISFYENGVHHFSIADLFTREESVHFALLSHPYPQKVLLIGGGISSVAQEILKHRVDSLTYVELDPLLINLGKKYLPPSYRQILEDKRVKIINQDGRTLVKKTKEKYDVVIINLPDPYNLQLNRFYTKEFFEEVKDILEEGGVLSFRLSSSENYLSREQVRLTKSIKLTLAGVFKNVLILPGDTNIFLATNQGEFLSSDYNLLLSRIEERKLNLKYINKFYLPARLSPFRIESLDRALTEPIITQINTDLKPISYFYDFILWSKTTSPSLEKMLGYLLNIKGQYLYLMLLTIFTILYIIFKGRGLKRGALFTSVSCLGLTEISLEVIILLSFQIFFGYIYSQLSLIIAAYMLGLAIGTVGGRRINQVLNEEKRFGALLSLELAMGLYTLTLLGLLKAISYYGLGGNAGFRSIFPLLTCLAGLIGGLQFPVANNLYLQTCLNQEASIGAIYSCDLFGSSLGALFVSTIIIPLFGVAQTLGLLVLINLLALALLILARKERVALAT